MTLRPDSAVARLMSWPVAVIDHEATLAEAAEALAADDVGALLVLRVGGVVGLLSERDVVAHVAAGADLSTVTVGAAMADDLVTATPETTVLEAANTMVDADVRHLPVLDGKKVAGVLSVRDVVAVLADALDGEHVVVVPSGTRVVVARDG